jgi:hypothetical protein
MVIRHNLYAVSPLLGDCTLNLEEVLFLFRESLFQQTEQHA